MLKKNKKNNSWNKIFYMLSFILIIFSFNAIEAQHTRATLLKTPIKRKTKPTKVQRYNWQHLDFFKDTILGVSADKAHKYSQKLKVKDTVIVAVIDSDIDLKHEDLINKIWINRGEIPNNQIDDDKNGYIDDINGWNFLSSTDGTSMFFSLMESTRILHEMKKIDFSKDTLSSKYLLFKAAKKSYDKTLNDVQEEIKILQEKKNKKLKYEIQLKEYFVDTILSSDSLKKYKKRDTTYIDKIEFIEKLRKKKISTQTLDDEILRHKKSIEICLNLDFDNRITIVGDDQNNINDTNYGSPLNGNAMSLNHGTTVASVIAANRNNNTGIKGIAEHVKIMPLNIASYGDYTDKDLALAIKYAINNGAKIINITQGKEFSIHPEWIDAVFKEAENKNVLIVCSAGNQNLNLDNISNYPNDTNEDGSEFVDNFIVVGASSVYPNEKAKRKDSNYGENSVDIFAPGQSIRVALPNNTYKIYSGTSYAAPIVSGIAALILSYYPDFTPKELKKIIFESGIKLDFPVNIEGIDNQVPFKTLSKTGKVVNAYNALLLAEDISNKTKEN